MTVVVLGIDALDPDIVDPKSHQNLVLNGHREIEPVISTATNEPSTHESWPTIITGLSPEEHGLQLKNGIKWNNPILSFGSTISNYVLSDDLKSVIGAWLLDVTNENAFRIESTYYEKNELPTIFDGVESKAIGVPNYVTNPDVEDREHELRKNLGNLFKHDPASNKKHKHSSSDPAQFYELCMEMSMIRIARTRRALRSKEYELIFGYTSGLDLVGHVSYQLSGLQKQGYKEVNEFVGELWNDLGENDELFIISDHGLQEGIHTNTAFLSGTKKEVVQEVSSVVEFKNAIEDELELDHLPEKDEFTTERDDSEERKKVKEHLEDLGYM